MKNDIPLWWKKMSAKAKAAYIKQHPNSKFATKKLRVKAKTLKRLNRADYITDQQEDDMAEADRKWQKLDEKTYYDNLHNHRKRLGM